MCFRTSHIYLSNIFIFQGRTPLGLCLGTWKVVIKKKGRKRREQSQAALLRVCAKPRIEPGCCCRHHRRVVLLLVILLGPTHHFSLLFVASLSSSSSPIVISFPPSSSHVSPSPFFLSCLPLLPPRRVIPPTSSLLYRAPFCHWALPSLGPSVIHQRWAVGRFGWSWLFASWFATVASCLPPLSHRDSLCGHRVAFVVVVGFYPSSLGLVVVAVAGMVVCRHHRHHSLVGCIR